MNGNGARRRAAAGFPAALAAFALASCAYFADIPGSRALVVGLNAYGQPVEGPPGNFSYPNDLSYCVSDAEAIGDELEDSGVETVRLLAAAAPTRTYIEKSDILEALAAAAVEARPKGWDAFYFYYSGHGLDGSGEIVMIGETDALEAIGAEELLAAVAAVPARVRVVVLDSCFSGNFVDSGSAVSPYPDDYAGTTLYNYPFSFTQLREAASAFSHGADGELIVLSASGASEESWESGALGHGVFTAGLLESAEKGDADGDGLVTLSEAYDHAAAYIQAEWNGIFTSSSAYYLPRLSGGALDAVLFR